MSAPASLGEKVCFGCGRDVPLVRSRDGRIGFATHHLDAESECRGSRKVTSPRTRARTGERRCWLCSARVATWTAEDGTVTLDQHPGADRRDCAGSWREVANLVDEELERQRARSEARRILDEEQRPARRPVVWDGTEQLVPMEWLVDGTIPAEGAGMLFGESDVGKTFVAVGLGVAVASGEPWLGRKVSRGSVLFVESEGTRSFALRKHAAKGAAGLGDGAMDAEALPFATLYEPLAFGPDTDVASAIARAAEIRAQVEVRKLPPIRLVVVDTLSQNLAGDADNNAEMQAFLRVYRAWLKALSAEPVIGLLLHHPGHAEKNRARGAYALPADLDLIMHLEGRRDALTLTCDRMRDERPFAPIALRLEERVLTKNGAPLRDARGRDVRSLVVVAGDEPNDARPPDPVRTALLDALPAWPEKWGMQSQLLPKVNALLGRGVSKGTVQSMCFALEKEGLAEKGAGARGARSHTWGKPESEPGPQL